MLFVLVAAGCATSGSTAEQRNAAAPAVAALQAGNFEAAQKAGEEVLTKDAGNSRAHVVVAFTRYKAAMHQSASDLRTTLFAAFGGAPNERYMRFAFEGLVKELAAVDAHLAAAAHDPDFDLELCLACWKVDWNHNGRIDDGDEKLFQIEVDADGKELPEDDPHRKPTYHFDIGDIHWARAMVSFQRAFLEIAISYSWKDLTDAMEQRHEPQAIVLRVADRARIQSARKLILLGLDEADAAREAYLRETDDDREWLPNPRQKNHPMPLPIDDAVFNTWRDVVGDLRRMLRSEEGLDVAAVAQAGHHQWENPPRGFIDLGKLLDDPHDIVLNFKNIDHAERNPEAVLRDLFGTAYVPSMKPSPLVGRLQRMAGEVERGEESFERKFRYLLWLN
jgi:hypothetical protein